MIKLHKKALSMILALSFLTASLCITTPKSDASDRTEGTYVGTVDLGDGFIVNEYMTYTDSLSAVTPRTATQGSGSKMSEIYYGSEYVCTIYQSATFIYGSPDSKVRIRSKQGFVYSYDSASSYRVGIVTNTTQDGSPAYVKSSFNICRASDWVALKNSSVYLYCKNSGLVY